MKHLELLRDSIESSRKECLENKNINEITKITLLDNTFTIFKLFHESCEKIFDFKSLQK